MSAKKADRATCGDNEKELSEVFHRVAEIRPDVVKLSPETQAKLDAYRAKRRDEAEACLSLVVVNNVCTSYHPMTQVYRASDGWRHPDAKFHDRDGDFHGLHKCPNCGLIFCVEL